MFYTSFTELARTQLELIR